MNNYASPISGIALPWISVIAIMLALLFPLSLYVTAGSLKNRLGLLGASVAGFAAACALGLIRGNSFRNILVLYSDAMVASAVGGLIISAVVHGIDPEAPVDRDRWTKFGYKVSGVLTLIICILLFLEYGPI